MDLTCSLGEYGWFWKDPILWLDGSKVSRLVRAVVENDGFLPSSMHITIFCGSQCLYWQCRAGCLPKCQWVCWFNSLLSQMDVWCTHSHISTQIQ